MKKLAIAALCSFPLFASSEFVVNLKDPIYVGGVMTTDQGGVITAPGIRIQAREIVYTNHLEDAGHVQKVEAAGNLLVDYGGRVFVGSKLEYDFTEKKGTVYDGKTFIDLWFIGGEKIILRPDHSFYIYNAFITTSENKDSEWDIYASNVDIRKRYLLSAQNVSFRFLKVPILWLPSFTSNLKFFSSPPVKYKVDWEAGQGPRVTMRYRIYSWEQFDLYARLDYRMRELNIFEEPGIGGAIETDYHSPDKLTRFVTKNYVAYDTFFADDDPNKRQTRFRLQGLYKSASQDGRTSALVKWDKYSDKNMPSDFKTSDFELSMPKTTEIVIAHRDPRFIAGAKAQPRINSFQGYNQELPTLKLSLRPFEVPDSGVITEHRIRSSYLDYSYSNDIDSLIPDFHAIRMETDHRFYRPINLKCARLTPAAGFTGIFYNNSPDKTNAGQAIFRYGGTLNTRLRRRFTRQTHILEPYINFEGLSNPTIAPDNVFVFNIQDGYNRLNMLRPGLRSSLYLNGRDPFRPAFAVDLFALSFFGPTPFRKAIPKIYSNLTWNFPRVALTTNVGWNIEKESLDRANIHLLWTPHNDFAFSLEYRHRGRFDWRKENHNNFILDVTRSFDELLSSPLSDSRNSFLTRMQAKLAPGWIVRFQSHSGWGRGGEPGYTETKTTLYTMITSSWRLRLTHTYTIRNPKKSHHAVGCSLTLVK